MDLLSLQHIQWDAFMTFPFILPKSHISESKKDHAKSVSKSRTVDFKMWVSAVQDPYILGLNFLRAARCVLGLGRDTAGHSWLAHGCNGSPHTGRVGTHAEPNSDRGGPCVPASITDLSPCAGDPGPPHQRWHALLPRASRPIWRSGTDCQC